MRDAAGDLLSLFGARRSRREHTASSLLPSAPQVVSYRIYTLGAKAKRGREEETRDGRTGQRMDGEGHLTYSSSKNKV